MLTALFGHHNGLEWNLGEENDYGTARREAFAAYLKDVDPYDHPVTTHTNNNQYEQFYAPLLGNGDFDITSFQGNASRTSMFDLIADWRQRSAAAGVPWAISFDEPQRIENDVLDDTRGYPHGRRDKMWPVFMAGGAGFEWYVQEDGGGHSFDQRIDDFSEMDAALRWTGHALGLLSALPLDDMAPDRTSATSVTSGEVYTLSDPGVVYLIYHDRAGGPLSLDLEDVPASEVFDVRWFDPREGGALQVGDVSEVAGGAAATALGSAPHSVDDDWVCLVLAQSPPIFSDGFESGDLSAWSDVIQP
ncbi:MAG: putative collagen-binding domain-containing protein, partial [Acidobacteriota bacterium]